VSTWPERRRAIRAHYEANLPVPENRVDLTALGGKAFQPPPIPSLSGLTAPQRLAALAAATWIRLQIVAVPGAKPFHLGDWAPTETKGSVRQAIFYPAGRGEDFLDDILESAMAVFHRLQTLSGGEIRFGDTADPLSVEQPEGSKFAQLHIVNEFTCRAAQAAA
jgi:hypothetical protein